MATIKFSTSEFKGSRLRCLILTSLSADRVAECINQLIEPHGHMDPSMDQWLPRGFLDKRELVLGNSSGFLRPELETALSDWWLKSPRGNKPHWDLASTCTINGRSGLVLVEAKAHVEELKADPKTPGNAGNEAQIRAALQAANEGLNVVTSHWEARGWRLSADTHYQLSNRFAWSWKLASLGVPVVLVYLGFLDAVEMGTPSQKIFQDSSAWSDCVLRHSEGLVPAQAWREPIDVNGTPMCSLIRSVDLQGVVS